ncbi:MAG: acyl--CoA ligase, partial [Clostridia bacterium]|nr:acyl--CoA ligase [Clostridia bacterium]
PAQLENIFDSCDLVSMSCVIGVPDPYKMQKVKVFVVPANGVEPSDATKEEVRKYASKRIAKYAMPKDLEFRAELPKTLVGKVAYRKLEEEEEAKRKAAAEAESAKAAEEAAKA